MLKEYEKATFTIVAFSENVIAASGFEDGEIVASWKSEWDNGGNRYE